MALIAPIIGAALGASAIGTAIIGAGLSFGLAYLARRLAPQPETRAFGMNLNLSMQANEPRQIIFGLAATAGSLEYHHVYGPNGNDYVQLVFALADHECDGLSAVYIDGVLRPLGDEVSTTWATGRTVSGYPNVMWIKFHSGAWGQSADADLVARGDWSAANRGRGVCYVRVTMKYDETRYKTGLPRFLFAVRGARLYDWRKDSTNGGSGAHRWGNLATYEYTANPAIILYNYLRGIYAHSSSKLGGMNVPSSALPTVAWSAAANACGESVAKKNGANEARYRAHCVIEVTTPHRTVVRELLATMAGSLIDSGGLLRPIAGVAQSPVLSITDDDLMANEDLQVVPKLSRAALVNAVFGTYSAPDQKYQATALPPRIAPDDEAADGGSQIPEHYGLGFVTSNSQGQRIMEIFRRRARHQLRASMRLRSRFMVLEPGDWVTWSSDRLGYENVTMEVVQVTLNRDLTATVELRETSAGIYSWTASSDELDPEAPREVSAGASTLDAVQGLTLQNVTVESAASGISRPGLYVTWTPIDDATVVEILIEYRRVGAAVAMERRVKRPETGSYTWVDGVQGGTVYEARALLVTRPERAVAWTGWASTEGQTAPQIVALAAEALYVDPSNLPPAVLNEQERFELTLAFAMEETFGSVNERLAGIYDAVERLAASVIAARIATEDQGASISEVRQIVQTNDLSLAQEVQQLRASLDDDIAEALSAVTTRVEDVEVVAGTKIRVFRQSGTPTATAVGDLWMHTGQNNRIYRASAVGSANWVLSEDQRIPALQTTTTALASSITDLTTRVDGNEAAAFQLSESVDGLSARQTLGVRANGRVGVIDLLGNEFGSTLTFVADTLYFAHPSVSNGNPIPLLVIRTVNGQARMVFTGEFITNSILAGEASFGTLAAIVANLGLIRAGRLLSNDSKFDINLDAKYIDISS